MTACPDSSGKRVPASIRDSGNALVIGIEDYQLLGIKVPGAEKSAESVADALKRKGFQVTTLLGEKATLAAVKPALSGLLKKSGGLRILYFNGIFERPFPRKQGYAANDLHLWAGGDPEKHRGRPYHEILTQFGVTFTEILDQESGGDLLIVLDYDWLGFHSYCPVRVGKWRIWLFGTGADDVKLNRGRLTESFLMALDGSADLDKDGETAFEEFARFVSARQLNHEGRPLMTNLSLEASTEAVLWKNRPASGTSRSDLNPPELGDLIKQESEYEMKRLENFEWRKMKQLASDATIPAWLRLKGVSGFLRKHRFDHPRRASLDQALEKLEKASTAGNEELTAGMILIPAGKAIVGCDRDKYECEPQIPHAKIVQLNEFYIDKTEVTLKEYNLCSLSGTCGPADPAGIYCVAHRSESGDIPVNCISWIDAGKYCAFAGKRLPTEHEWERAARGSDGRAFPWGDWFDPTYSNWGDFGEKDGYLYLAAPGSFPKGASPFGVLDMTGSLNEFVSDTVGVSEVDESGKKVEVQWPIAKGGGWGARAEDLPAYRRWPIQPNQVEGNWGFRCVKSVKSQDE